VGLYNNNNKSRNIHNTLTLNANPNSKSRFCQVKVENYGIIVTPDKNWYRKVKTDLDLNSNQPF